MMVVSEEYDILHVHQTKVDYSESHFWSSDFSLGIFVQPSSLQKLTPIPYSPERERKFRPINFPMLDTSIISSRVDTGNHWMIEIYLLSHFFFKGLKRDNSADGRSIEQFQLNDRVSLTKNRHGTIRYVGSTPLGSGKISNEIDR
jgi:hypothetical protein